MSRWLAMLLCGLMAVLLISAQPVPGASAPTLRDMAACCRHMRGHCPETASGKSCCLQLVQAPVPTAINVAAPTAPAPVTSAGTPVVASQLRGMVGRVAALAAPSPPPPLALRV